MCFGAGLSLDGSACDMSSQPIEQESCNAHPCDEGEGTSAARVNCVDISGEEQPQGLFSMLSL